MKLCFTILIFLIVSCSPVKDIEVTIHEWTLVGKRLGYRYIDKGDEWFMWLTWQSANGEIYSERMSEYEAEHYPVGTIILNRDRR